MDLLLIAGRSLQFVAAILLTGIFAFECLVAAPGFRAAGADWREARRPRCQLHALAWASLVLLLVSGAAWLIAVAAAISGEPLGQVWAQGTLGIVLTQTRFGNDWLWRGAGAALLGMLLAGEARLVRRRAGGVASWAALALSAASLAALAWAGHGAATAGRAGELHLAGDILHLLAAGTWLGTLPPLALLLAAIRHAEAGSNGACNASGTKAIRPQVAAAIARPVIRRYSVMAAISVAALLAGGLINTWFLAGTVPALVGTLYGRLLLLKIGLFVAMLLFAAVNLLRLSPRLAVGGGAIWRPLAQLRRGAILETGLGIGVLAVVGVLGILPPGLHTEPGWPLPFRIDVAALDLSSTVAVASLAAVAAFCAIGAMAAAAAGRYRIMLVLGAEFALCAALGWLPLRGVVEQAYPTSFYAPAEAYDAASVVRGQAVFAANCTACHGANGRGDGPAAAGLPVRPANLTESHLFAHTPGDLFWWISRGRHDGAMPGFANSLSAGRRWDAINFIRARAAGDLVQQIGPQVSAEDTYPVPDFSFASGRVQQTLNRTLLQGPMLVVLYDGEHPPLRRLGTPAAARARLAAAGLRAIAIDLGEAGSHASAAPLAVAASPAGIAALSLFRSPNDGGESELLLDRNGTVRARWTAAGSAGLPGMEALAAAAARAARIPVSPPSHGGHAH